MVTIKDIADRAGVAKSTVSRFLNGGSISKKTADVIQKVIDETGYVPNTFAQSLKAKNSRMIGAIIPRLDSYAATTILSGIENQLKQRGYHLTIINTNLDGDRELEALRHFQVTKMDGVIFLMTHFSTALEETIQKMGIPVVAIGQDSPIKDAIYFNEQMAGEMMADHLYRLGHRHLHFLAVTQEDPAVGIYRKQGLKEKFLSYKDTEWEETQTGFRLEEAYRVTKDKLLAKRPSLIVGATDMIAIGAMRACLEAGIGVPRDISIAGFGNHAIGTAFYPRLTTIQYPFYEAGEIAAEHIINRIAVGKIEENFNLDTELIEGESVLDLRR